MWGEGKLAAMLCSGSLAPRFTAAEIICSTVHAHHEVLSWSHVVCITCVCELHLKGGGFAPASWQCPLGQP